VTSNMDGTSKGFFTVTDLTGQAPSSRAPRTTAHAINNAFGKEGVDEEAQDEVVRAVSPSRPNQIGAIQHEGGQIHDADIDEGGDLSDEREEVGKKRGRGQGKKVTNVVAPFLETVGWDSKLLSQCGLQVCVGDADEEMYKCKLGDNPAFFMGKGVHTGAFVIPPGGGYNQNLTDHFRTQHK
jgi:hypothetical protein